MKKKSGEKKVFYRAIVESRRRADTSMGSVDKIEICTNKEITRNGECEIVHISVIFNKINLKQFPAFY